MLGGVTKGRLRNFTEIVRNPDYTQSHFIIAITPSLNRLEGKIDNIGASSSKLLEC